jgi:hypothetical protein
MHGDQALAIDYDDPCARGCWGRPLTCSGLLAVPSADGT